MELSKIKGCGPKTIEYLNKLNITDVDSLVRFFPYRYNIFTPVNLDSSNEEDTIVISGTVTSPAKVSYIRRNFNRLSFTLETNNILTNVIIYNRAFLSQHIIIGKKITLIGKYNKLKNQFTASDIKLFELTSTRVEPVYHMVNGLKASTITKCINNALTSNINITEIIPEYLSRKYELINTIDAIKEIHNPTNTKLLKQARLKLIYEELFEFMFKINLIKYKNQIFDDFVVKEVSNEMVDNIIKEVPFELTSDQRNAIKEIVDDFNDFKRMNRLILGDVGSGKTIVSFIAILINHLCGYQSALLAPTEVLAHQHFDNFTSLFPNVKAELLVGSLTQKEKKCIIEKLKNNEIDVLIGTHAMLESSVEFANIGLVVTDEQHRFGVNQRKTLQNKGKFVDVLYMSATPIPRTYALTIYGDMDISYIKEKPAGRKEIITTQYKFTEMKSVGQIIENELKENHQAYVIAPLIEDENETELNDLKQIEDILKRIFKVIIG